MASKNSVTLGIKSRGIRYQKDYNPIKEYHEQIETGQETACKKLRRTIKKLVNDLTRNDWEWYYSNARANHVIEFIENYCRHSKGKMGGKPVILELWEKAIIAGIFGFIDIEGNRKHLEGLLIVAKKNGKSLIASCVGLYLQNADGEAGPEVYAVATKKDQAKIIWLEAKRMVNKSPSLSKRIRRLVAELVSDFNDGIFKPLASDSDTLDGLNVHGALLDEIHQWKNGMSLYNIIADGVSAREQPLIFITSTAGIIREDIYDQKYEEYERIIQGYDDGSYSDERRIGFIYELDSRDEWQDETCWRKANPGLGTIKKLRTLREKVERAKSNSLLLKNLLCKEFNIRETDSQSWLSYETLANDETYEIKTLKPRYGIIGLDLSDTTDLTCATVLFRVPNDEHVYVKQMYWIPSDRLDEHIKTDKVPYDIWMEKGWLRLCEGNRIDYHDVTKWFREVQVLDDIYFYKAGYDSWNAKFIVDELELLVGKANVVPVIQGPKTFSSPLKAMEAELNSKKVNYDNNPILRWCLGNAKVKIDSNDNFSLIKTSNATKRIDGVASMMDAYIVYENYKEEYMTMI